AAAAAEREAAAAARGRRRVARAEPDGAANEALARAVAAGEVALPGLGRLPSRHEGWSVATVNAVARELVEGALPPLWVVGEVANFTRARSGHCYFTLRDETAQLRCVMWRDEARRLPTAPGEGMQLRAL